MTDIKKKLTISAFSTLVAEIITLPICTVKTIYQTSDKSIKQIISSLKFSGYFQASIPAITSQVISTATKFSAYELIKNYRQTEKGDILNNSLNGLMGGLIGSIFTHPFDLWKNLNQRNLSFKEHLLDNKVSLSKLVKNGLYQGYSGSIGKNTVLYSCLFSLNDYYSTKFNNIWLSAPATTITIGLITQPIDYYKVRKMANLKEIKNPFRGTVLMLARNIPHFAITMALINMLSYN
jgi:hypothetical protein